MAADIFGFYTTASLGLFTVISIILGYVLLNTAIINAARGSAYYAYTRIADAMDSAASLGHSSMTNINIYPKYVIFSAYFNSLEELDYEVMKGMRVFSYGVNHENFRQILNDIVASGTGESYINTNSDSRVELKKCVGDACLCFGEMEAVLDISPEYFIPLACADICWGEEPGEYPLQLDSTQTPRSQLLKANNYVAAKNPLGKCAECVNYINSDKYSVFSSQGFNALVAKHNDALSSEHNREYLREFSKATKFSFVPNIIECRPMKEIISDTGKQDSLFFFKLDSERNGVFVLLNSPKDSVIFKIFSLDYYDKKIETSFLRAEAASDAFGGFSI